MDFRQIEAFLYVVRLKSFSKAADAIFLTQPTISAHISSLESELGVKLIDRSGKEILPTKAGKIFYDFANNLINTRDNAIYTLNEFSNKLEGKVDIAVSSGPGQYMLPALMKGFHEKYSNASFSIFQMDSKEVIEAVLDKTIELGIAGTYIESSKLEYQHLTDDRLVLITPNNAKYQAIPSGTIPFSYIEGEAFIFRESGSGTRQEFEKKLKENGYGQKSLKIIAYMNNLDAIKHSVSLGLGVAIVSAISVKDYIDFGLVKAFSIEGIDMMRSFYIVNHKNRPISPINAAFLEYVKSYFGQAL